MGNTGVKHTRMSSFRRAYKLTMLTLRKTNQCRLLLKVENVPMNGEIHSFEFDEKQANTPAPVVLTTSHPK